jgi:DNA-binding beta-propeller fold protein YncE
MRMLTSAVAILLYSNSGAANVPQFGTAATRVLTIVGTTRDGLDNPTALAFNPDAPDQLWTVNRAFNGTVMFTEPGTANQTVDKRVDTYSGHFMHQVSAIAFGDRTFLGGMTFATCQESNNRGNDFMGPTLWPADLAVYARVNQRGPLLGSHIDMLHQSPLCMGIAHDQENVFWVTDGRNGHVVRYDFVADHGPGHDDHSDGIVRRYPEATFTRVQDVPGHVLLDKLTGWLYVADTGAGRVYRMDTRSGAQSRTLTPRNEPLAEFSEWRGATIEVLLTGLDEPSGLALSGSTLFVSLHGTGEIVAIDVNGRTELERIATGAQGISGLAVGPDARLWYTDIAADTVVRVDP